VFRSKFKNAPQLDCTDSSQRRTAVGSGSHLAVHGVSSGAQLFVVILVRKLRDHHTVGDHNTRSIRVAREQSAIQKRISVSSSE
jgi:hypothetical protein